MKKELICCLLAAGLLLPGTAALAEEEIPECPYDETGTLEPAGTVAPPTVQQPVRGAEEIRVYVAGKQVVFSDQKPIIENGRTLLPVRAVSEAMAKSVAYNNGVVEIADKQKQMTLYIGKQTVAYHQNNTVSAGTLDVTPMVFNGRTMLPIRAIAEFFDYQVDWNDNTRTLTLHQ